MVSLSSQVLRKNLINKMNSPEENFKPEQNNEIFNPNDPWDVWLIKNYGYPDMFDDEEEIERKSKLTGDELLQVQYENAISNSEGDLLDPDGNSFGSFSGLDGDLQIEAVENTPTPEEMEIHMDGSLRVRADYSIHFQVDGPSTGGHMWQARLFDQIKGKEIPNTRVMGNKLSYVMGAVMKHMPKYADEYMPIEKFQERNLKEAERIDRELEDWEKEEKSIKEKYPDYEPKDLMNLVMEQDESFSDIFMYGSLADYVKRKIESLKAIKNKDEQMVAARKFSKEFYVVVNSFRKIFHPINDEKHTFLRNKGEPGYEDYFGDEDNETDGWMKPPDWKE